ncbi:hypothetical protein ABT084_13065 [Streptomyces sp. NPDC002138]|uniref:hypothetical protein n=1 Tax=Streptomyces sp. NPDC002138 TaxID=3154410 RepID=UPI00333437F8
MTSFATHRLRVHDRARPPHRRLSALRTCLTQFAPYGLRATYHHLCASARVPADLGQDPEALVRAVEELHAAREVWTAEFARWRERRTAQKHAGVRVPDPAEPPRRLWCPDIGFHPTRPLPEVMERVLRAGRGPGCPVCGEGPGTTEWHDGWSVHRLCARCGVSLGARDAEPPDPGLSGTHEERWKAVWRREARGA